MRKYLDILDETPINNDRLQRAKQMGFNVSKVFYHGSPVADLDEISHMNTSYGIFFTPDPNTASYYASGGKIYECFLRVNNVADFDDGEVFLKIAKEAIDYSTTRDKHEALKFAERLYKDGYQKNAVVTRFFDNLGDLDVVDDVYTMYDVLVDERVSVSDIDDLVNEIGLPKVINAYNEYAPEMSEELNAVIDSYGSQEFYLEYQSDMLRTAKMMGYDAVDLSDPSSTGESISRVVFDPSRIRTTDAAFELSKKNSSNIHD